MNIMLNLPQISLEISSTKMYLSTFSDEWNPRFFPTKTVPIISSVFKYCTWSHLVPGLLFYFLIFCCCGNRLIPFKSWSPEVTWAFVKDPRFCMPRCANKLTFFPELTLGSQALQIQRWCFLLLFFFSFFGWYILGVNRSVCRYKSTFTVPFSVESVDRWDFFFNI